MKKLTLMLVLLPALAMPAPQSSAPPPVRGPGQGGAGPGAGPDDAAHMQRMQKRMRLAATLGLAEALDLDDQGTLRVRDVIAHDAERRMPLQRQVRDNVRILRDAARGDQAAAGQVEAALGRLRDVRTQLQNLDNETFKSVTQGLSPDKKAKAALFLARFRERGRHMAMMHGAGHGGGYGHMGPGHMGPAAAPRGGMMDDERRGPGGGPGRGQMGPGMNPQRHASSMGEPDLEEWFSDD
jgi:hypothetical protein